MSRQPIAAATLMVPSVVVYPNVIRKEEAHLERLFGAEFLKYRSQVPAFFPRFRSVAPFFSFSQYLANREYNTALGFAAAFALLLLKAIK